MLASIVTAPVSWCCGRLRTPLTGSGWSRSSGARRSKGLLRFGVRGAFAYGMTWWMWLLAGTGIGMVPGVILLAWFVHLMNHMFHGL